MSRKDSVLTHRSFVFDGISVSVPYFFALLEQAIAARRIPGARVSRVLLREGGIFGARREYLKVKRGPHEYLISAAPFGDSFMVTYRLRKLPSRAWLWIVGFILVASHLDLVSESLYFSVINCFAWVLFMAVLFIGLPLYFIRKIPGIGFVTKAFWSLLKGGWQALSLPTVWQSDVSAAFQEMIPSLLVQTVNAIKNGQGLRAVGGQMAAGALPPARGV